MVESSRTNASTFFDKVETLSQTPADVIDAHLSGDGGKDVVSHALVIIHNLSFDGLPKDGRIKRN